MRKPASITDQMGREHRIGRSWRPPMTVKRLEIVLALLLAALPAGPFPVASGSPSPHSELADIAFKVGSLRTEYGRNPIGIDSPRPRLSWQISSDRRGVVQSAYQVRVARTELE